MQFSNVQLENENVWECIENKIFKYFNMRVILSTEYDYYELIRNCFFYCNVKCIWDVLSWFVCPRTVNKLGSLSLEELLNYLKDRDCLRQQSSFEKTCTKTTVTKKNQYISVQHFKSSYLLLFLLTSLIPVTKSSHHRTCMQTAVSRDEIRDVGKESSAAIRRSKVE